MRPSSAKAKGRRLQQQIATDLCAALELSPDDCRSCPMGSHGADVQLSAAARARVPWSIECKNQEKLNMWAAFEQAEAHAASTDERRMPVVVAKRNHKEALCTMRWTDALALLVEAKRPRGAAGEGATPADDVRTLRRLADRLEQAPEAPAE